MRSISARGNVGNYQVIDPLRVVMSEHQRRFPAHAVPDDGGAVNALVVHEDQQIVRHAWVIMHGMVRTASVISLIYQVHAMVFGKLLTQGLPIIRCAQ